MALSRKKVISQSMDCVIPKLFHTNTAADRLLKRLLTSISLLAPIATLVRRRTDSAFTDRSSVAPKAPKKELKEATDAYGNFIGKLKSRSDSGSEEPRCSRYFRFSSKIRDAIR